MTASHSCSVMAVSDLSLKIPALATKIWTPPKVSNATLTRASPSSAEHIAAAALPPASAFFSYHGWCDCPNSRTFDNFVNDSPCILLAHVVHNYVGPQPCEQQRVGSAKSTPGARDNDSLSIVPDLGRDPLVRGSTSCGLKFALQFNSTSIAVQLEQPTAGPT